MLKGKRYTTVNTDAGVRNGVSAVAYWVKTDGHTYKGSKKLKQKNLDSNHAELRGILIGLTIVAQTSRFRSADVIVVNCDNINALNWLKNRTYPKEYQPIIEAIEEQVPFSKVKFKHVKGHVKEGAAKHFVNNWCDKEARKHY